VQPFEDLAEELGPDEDHEQLKQEWIGDVHTIRWPSLTLTLSEGLRHRNRGWLCGRTWHFCSRTLDFSHSYPEFCHPKDAPPTNNMISGIERQHRKGKFLSLKKADSAIGAALCAIGALAASSIASGHSWESTVPLAFSVFLLAVAVVFGMRAGVIGSIVAALVFAAFLFSPIGSVRVSSEAARSNLGWMLLIGVAFSFLFAPPTSSFRRH
jgi:K+-sensing histidine kinase KdpD